VTTTSDRPIPSGRAATKPPPTGAGALTKLIRRVHFYAGILVAPFLVVLCLTGIAYVFTPQLNDLVYADELLVEPQAGPNAALDAQVAAATAAYPGIPVKSVRPSVEADRTTMVELAAPDAPEGETLAVFVNPYTGEVAGSFTLAHGEPPMQRWLRDLHGDLNLGTPGAIYSEFAASWLPVLFIGGIILWVGKRRARRRDLVVPTAGPPGRARLLGWHGSVGIWLTAALVFISLTGLTWSTFAGDRFKTVLTALDARTPSVTAEAPTGPTLVTVGQAEAIGRQAGFQGPLTITPPTAPGKPLVVAETSDTVPLHRDKLALDPATGAVLERLDFAEYPFLAQLTTIGIRAHTGTLFGLTNQIAMTAMSLGIMAMVFWGYRMWWLRRPTRGGWARALEPRGILRTTSQPVLFAVVLGVLALAWLLPVFGVSLALFLVYDAVVGARAARRVSVG
jgi:uncharacterized iron-regulated membrane protein